MSYVKLTNYAIKDALLTGDPNKIVKGADIDAEFNAIATASAVTDAAYVAADAVVTAAYVAADAVVAATVASKLDTATAAITYAPLSSPALVGVPTAPTAPVGTNTTQIATMAALLNQAFTTGFPSQAGNAGKFATTDGTTVSWAQVLPSYTGNALKVLRVNAGETDTEWTTPEPVGLKLLATLTPTAAANVDALTVFTSTYDNYLILLSGIGHSAAANDRLFIRFAVAGVVETSANYHTLGATPATQIYAHTTNMPTANNASMRVIIHNANSTTLYKSIDVSTVYKAGSETRGGCLDLASAITGIRFLWEGGNNFKAQGKIRIYGYQNS